MNTNTDNLSNRKIISLQLFEKLLKHSLFQENKNVIQLVEFKQGDEIYKAGKNARNVYCMKQGLVKLLIPDESGKETMVRLIENHEFFALLSLVKNHKYTRSAVAITPVETYRIDSDFFLSSIQTDIEVSNLFSQFLLEVLFAAETKLNELIVKSVEERLALVLITQCKTDGNRLFVNLNKKDLAMMVGTIQETLSRKLASLSRKGYIKLSGKEIIITNPVALQNLSH